MALSVLDIDRANKFYGETLGLPPEYENREQGGYLVGQTILMLKANWDVPLRRGAKPACVTIETEDARETEKGLRARGVVVGDSGGGLRGSSIMWVVSWTARGTSFGFAHTFEQSVPIQATLFQSQASSTVEGAWGATEQNRLNTQSDFARYSVTRCYRMSRAYTNYPILVIDCLPE